MLQTGTVCLEAGSPSPSDPAVMLDVVKMKEACRICARELCGNQRRWIFHPGAKLSLQVLLSHALGCELCRDGRREFACSKCTFMLERMYRFDTVIARVEALSLERLQKLLLEKERLRQCIGGLYQRNNPEEPSMDRPEDASVVDLPALHDVSYSDLIQEDLVFSVYESWADKEDPALDQHLHQCTGADSGPKPRRCRGCAALRVADSDYEAVCRVPRRIGRRSTSCGPSTRCSAAALGVEDLTRTSATSEATTVLLDTPSAVVEADKISHSPASSVESLEIPTNHKVKEEPDSEEVAVRRDPLWRKTQSECSLSGLEMLLSVLRGWEYRPVKPPRGSKLPVLVKAKLEQSMSIPVRSPYGGAGPCEMFSHPAIPEVVILCPEQELQAELAEIEEQWQDDYIQCGPFRFQQKLQDRLAEMELQLRSAQEEAQQQERNIQNLSDSMNSKETEVSELCRVIEEQNKMLCSLRELANHSQLQQLQLSGTEAAPGQGEILALQASLFQAQLELQAGQRAQRQAARIQEDQNRALERLERDLQVVLQHRRETERHNQELQLALQKARSALQDKEEQLGQSEHDRQREKEERERIVGELRTFLQIKEQLVEEYREMLKEPKENRDSLLQKLRQRITKRDRALEAAVDKKFRSMEEKEEDTRRLQVLLRENERDLERQRCVLANNEETIASLEALLRGKALELDQVSVAWRNVQKQQQDVEDQQKRILGERDCIIDQLQAALLARTQEAQDLRCSLLPQIHSAPGHVLEELKVRLQLKDHLFQNVMSDRTRQAQEHQEQLQDLLRTISTRDQYIQDSAGRLTEVLNEQSSRVQELRSQLSSGSGSKPVAAPELALEVQALQEELRLALIREKENHEERRNQAGQLDSLSRSLNVKDEMIRGFQRQLVDPSDLPLVERLTQEVQELKEILVQQDAPRPDGGQPMFGELSCEDEGEADDLKSDIDESVDDESGTQDLLLDGEGLIEVKQLVEHKQVLERELGELKGQLEKAGYSSLSQMRRALFILRAENEDLKLQLQEGPQPDRRQAEEPDTVLEDEEEEEELDVTVEEEEESSGMWDAWDGELSSSDVRTQSHDDQKMEEANHLLTSSLLDDDQSSELVADQQQDASSSTRETTVCLQLKSRELQERLMVSEATVQAQAEQLKDYRELLTDAAVQQDSKQIQVDLQDLGYETCGRSENEAEREEASSPEFDDLEMCLSLDCGSQWWPTSSSSSSTKTTTQTSGYGDNIPSLQRLVEDLRSQLSRSQGVIRGLQSRLCSLSTSSDCEPSALRKVNWSLQASQSGAEDDEGWQSSDGGALTSQRHQDKDLQELTSRVDALEDQLRKGGKMKEDGSSANWPGKFDSLIKAQSRELSHLRQRLREGRGVCSLLIQHLGDTTKAFEELLRANDIDYYMGQSLREQLAQSSGLAQRVSARISGRDQSEDADEKTELLAIRLSKELQQKDKVIESLQAELKQHQGHHRSDTPSSSHALSDITDQSDRISYVSDEHGSTNEDLVLCSDPDAASEIGLQGIRTSTKASTDSQRGSTSRHPSAPSSITSSHRTQSCLSCPSMHLTSSPHNTADLQSHSALCHPPLSSSSLKQSTLFPLHLSPMKLQPQRSEGAGFSLAEVHQELQMLQKQLTVNDRFSSPQSRSLHGFPFAHQHPADPSGALPLSYQGFQPSPFSSSSLGGNMAMKAGASLLERSALWEMPFGNRPARAGADLSSGSSGYQSGTSRTGSDLMTEHLREIRSLRQRLEDSIQTNDRLRQQLEVKLAHAPMEKGAPTNIYIQGLDSVTQLSSEIRLLKEENISLQTQLKLSRDGSREAQHLREVVLLERSRLKEAELETQRWAELSKKLQAEDGVRCQEVAQLKQDRQRSQEAINRLQHEASVLRQQLDQNRSLIQTLQNELQEANRRVCEATANTHSDQVVNSTLPGRHTVTFDPKDLHTQLEQQLNGQANTPPAAGRRLFIDKVLSPPVRDTGLISPSSPLRSGPRAGETADTTASTLQSGAPDGSFTRRHGHPAVGHVKDFKALQQQLLEGTFLVIQMEDALCSLNALQRLHQPFDPGCVRNLLSDTKTLKQILQEAESLLQVTCRAGLSDPQETKQDESLIDEVVSLRLKLSEQEQALKGAMERLRTSNLTKDSMEQFIVSQLSRTRDVLKKAKTNLQENKLRISSLHQASVTVPPSSPSPLSSPLSVKGENPGSFGELTSSADWSVLTSSSSAAWRLATHQRPLQVVYL
ncbi:myomegalin isoform X4 [Girardinichthys multiradiatus]|uniref:myomegalin isoform X4 n=1 Tax=Girardinichthys multiradiatus TaxID=208333 RepID=UPI001FAE5413|nr:myomegalin isoform X4 [Girardinichthys multiradiatus]